MKGLNLFTGSVDSGKTTTIFACLKYFILHDLRSAFINTYENPIEADLRKIAEECPLQNKSVFQCPVPQGVTTFEIGVEQSLRRNADIIVTGEVRTRDEILAVVNGVLATGKLLMATLHTDNIAVTINRLIRTLKTESEGETKSIIYDLISSLNLIVSQKLLTTVDLNRVAVSEVLHFTKEVKERLHNVEIDQISREVKSIMLEKNDTMVDKAKTLFRLGKITETVYNDFKESFSY
jgi:Tfp pilus assembly pilus retraction ATPase PilT